MLPTSSWTLHPPVCHSLTGLNVTLFIQANGILGESREGQTLFQIMNDLFIYF